MNKKIEGGDGAVTNYGSPVDNSADRAQQGEPVAVQAAFEAWAKREGAVNLKPAADYHCEDGRFPATYYYSGTETAWRAWANKPGATKAAAPDAPIDCLPWVEARRDSDARLRDEKVAVQRARMQAKFANRPRTAATADFDLPAPNDAAPVPDTGIPATGTIGHERIAGMSPIGDAMSSRAPVSITPTPGAVEGLYTFKKPEGWLNLANPSQSWEEWTREQGAPTTKGWKVGGAKAGEENDA